MDETDRGGTDGISGLGKVVFTGMICIPVYLLPGTPPGTPSTGVTVTRMTSSRVPGSRYSNAQATTVVYVALKNTGKYRTRVPVPGTRYHIPVLALSMGIE